MKRLVNTILSPLGLEIKRKFTSHLEHGCFREIDEIFRFFLRRTGHGEPAAQLSQDIFALVASNMKQEGYFVEFGATNGVDLSNTLLLEKSYGWKGILAEPDPRWHDELMSNRACVIDKRCVWRSTGEVIEFSQAPEGEFSTISEYKHVGAHQPRKAGSGAIKVDTVSLNDLLGSHSAPSGIDFLSIDTEGSELEILAAFDLSRYCVSCIVVEHNFTRDRDHLKDLLEAEGFRRVFEYVSRWDDWYVRD